MDIDDPNNEDRGRWTDDSRAEAVNSAMKLAFWHSKVKGMINFYPTFHDRAQGALSPTSSKARLEEMCIPGRGGLDYGLTQPELLFRRWLSFS